ncbi:serine/threonine-protein kinase ULK1a isoform X5 [Pelmatolapia mariae]|uniref:serine/threonine-protein kinase ULK1a isoform X5 n=1 Tax=Pelmatolapia mariae TaxID=158779 RepID=UPI002FE63609
MESIGKFEFSRKDLIGHGAFAVVFKGRHKEKRDWEVAVKCINKKNLGKSQCLLAKEIKILKELKHENIVRLLDYQETGGCVYLVMEYCNGGDLAEYLHSKGTLSEDTIRVFLQQISRAMKVLHSKGIVHRDLKPQNILLCHPEGRRSSSINTTFKLADFGFARHLQTNTMAATLCGSPMYMAPEVIMSRNYNAKADLWSIGTIVYQSLTGKAPFYASTPHELRLFYESNRNLFPNIPKETSDNLKHLLLGLLRRNHKDRISFEEFFNHPFLETSSSTKKFPVHSYPSSGSGSSSSSSSTSQLASPQHSDGEMHQPQPKLPYTPVQDKPGFLQKETANQDGRYIRPLTEDYVLVPAQFPSEHICEVNVGSPPESSLKDRGSSPLAERGAGLTGKTPPRSPMLRSPPKPVSKPAETLGSNFSPSVPIPVPTQIQNYQRMQCVGSHGSTRVTLYCPGSPSSSESPPQYEECGSPSPVFTFNSGGSQPQQSSPLVGTSPKTSEQTLPLSTRTGLLAASPDMQDKPKQQVQPRMPNRTRTVPNLQSLDPTSQANLSRKAAIKKGPFKRSVSTGRLSDMLLKAALGAQLFEEGRDESFSSEKSMEITAPPAGCHGVFRCSDSPVPMIFTMGSPSSGNSPPDTMLMRRFSELPEDTLMEEAHTDALTDLRFTLAFVQCVMELASSKDPGLEPISSPDVSFLDQSLVADQISLLSREWSYAEQLVLYMKAEEFLSSALRSAKENIKKGELFPSTTVKQVIRKLNELYKNCVTYCRSLSDQLQTFLLNKQKLMDNFNALTAEKLIYNHTVHMVKSAALDEMFHHGTTSVQRYHKALVLMEGLSRTLKEQEDIDGIEKCKQCIERRLSALHTKQYL